MLAKRKFFRPITKGLILRSARLLLSSNFDEALNALPPDKREGTAALTGLDYCNQLFAWEERFKGLSPEEAGTHRVRWDALRPCLSGTATYSSWSGPSFPAPGAPGGWSHPHGAPRASPDQLFAWEERFKGLSPEERTKQRLKEEKPILDALLAWADSISGSVAPKSALGKALHYLREQWPYLLRYLEDGRLELSNNRALNGISTAAH